MSTAERGINTELCLFVVGWLNLELVCGRWYMQGLSCFLALPSNSTVYYSSGFSVAIVSYVLQQQQINGISMIELFYVLRT
jgi:hypothetical protein